MKLKGMTAGVLLGAATVVTVPLAVHAQSGTGTSAGATATVKTPVRASVVYGKLTGTISSNSLSVQAPSGGATTAVALSAGTRFVAHDVLTAIAGLKVGENVVVAGRVTNGTFHAGVVEYGLTPFGYAVRIAGNFVTQAAGGIIISSGLGQQTIATSGSTVYRVNGARVSSLPASLSNQHVTILAEQMTTGALVAKQVVFGQALGKANQERIAGTVNAADLIAAAAGNGTITVTEKSGATVTVQLTSSTAYILRRAAVHITASSLPALPAGAKLRVQILATKGSNGALTAAVVRLVGVQA